MLKALLGLLTLASVQQQAVVSPEVHPDRTVTFRCEAPNAQDVSVSIEGGKAPLKMTKGAGGVWSVTTGALEPDIYGYSFNIDGKATLDSHNPAIKPNLIWVGNMVTIPGKQVWEPRTVPKGTVHHHFFHSKAIGAERDFFVYTPPGFSKAKKLPVMYLLHGYSDMASGWTEVGKAHVILDNLLAEGKIKPMVVVMPLGYGVPDFASPNGRNFGDRQRTLNNFTRFETSLLTEVRPMVESTYGTATTADKRAICGLSMGGAESLFIGLKHTDTFHYIGGFSSGGFPANKPEEVFPHLTKAQLGRLKYLWMTCGTDDGLIGFQRGFSTWLKGKGAKIETQETGGGHVWMLWRRALSAFSQKLFK